MSLIEKVIRKYTTPEVEIVNFEGDVITSSSPIPMAKLSPEELVEESNKKRAERENERKFVEFGTGNVTNIYPDGVPLEVLKLIDFKYFGAMLKQEQLLPPSYDRKPVKVEFEDWCGYPRIFLTFKSKTSESYRLVGICRYSVAYSTRMDKPVKVMETNPLMIPIWRRFAERVMWAWERGYNYALVGPEKNLETYGKPRVNESMLEFLNERERIRAWADASMKTDAEYKKMIKEFETDNSKSSEEKLE